MYRALRADVDANFAKVYQQAVRMAAAVGEEPRKPRVVGRQINRANNPSESAEDHYRRNVVIPFLDHVIESLDNKFDSKCQYTDFCKKTSGIISQNYTKSCALMSFLHEMLSHCTRRAHTDRSYIV